MKNLRFLVYSFIFLFVLFYLCNHSRMLCVMCAGADELPASNIRILAVSRQSKYLLYFRGHFYVLFIFFLLFCFSEYLFILFFSFPITQFFSTDKFIFFFHFLLSF